jgi:hypothetical protein
MGGMSLAEAWTVLGEDPAEVLLGLKSKPDLQSRVRAARELLINAERISKNLMAAHHPDRNQGDLKAQGRFLRVKAALDSIRLATEELEKKAAEPPKDDGKVKIVLK